MRSPLADRNLLVTGGTGSFGHAFIRRALDDGAKRVVCFSRDELKQATMRAAFGDDPRLRFFIGDVRDRIRLRIAMQGVQDVIHAAAMKRIEVCEAEPYETVATNILGTQNVAQVAIDSGVERAVFLSTDKAPIPSTLYGMTKAVAERVWVRSNAFVGDGPTRLNAVRYGNVVGSRGSVLALFKAQRDAGQPLTLTDERMTRFWMGLNQSVDIVCTALACNTGGSIFVPKVLRAPLLTFAQAVVGPALYAPGHVVTGLRPGERMHETLIADHEAHLTRDAGSYYVIRPEDPSWSFAPTDTDRMPDGFTLRSDSGEPATAEELRRMVA